MSIVVVVSIAAALSLFQHAGDAAVSWAILSGGTAVAVVGYLDDRSSLPVYARLVVHVASAAWSVYLVGGMPAIPWGTTTVQIGIWGDLFGLLAIVWMLNLFNFMDGIDGIAASEAIFVAGAAAFLTLCGGGSVGVAAVALALGGACLGFLLWNWPPAKIFMGDVGSGYLGYVIGVLALAAGRQDPTALWVWLILGGVFFVDATVTLIRRVLRGDRVYEAHRSHAYQWLARRWQSHESVTIATTAVNMLWLLPCAWFAARNPKLAVWTVVAALSPIALLAILAGAGRRETH
jgi:Fuc2NAc and GlcNAc transferase